MNALEKIMRRPGVAHLMAANDRFNKRLGPQFAAAITYFTVLSLVPILMFAVSVLGFTLTALRPDLLQQIQQGIQDQLGGSLADSVGKVVENAFSNWRGLGIVALLTAGYSGSAWAGNLKKAFRVMWRDRFSEASESKNFFVELLHNLGIFMGMLVTVALAVSVTSVGATFSDQVISFLNLQDVPGIGIIVRAASIAAAFLAGWIMFAFMFWVLPGQGTTKRSWIIGTLAGATVFTLLQQLGGLLLGAFQGNAAASFFGPVIILMLLINIVATVILMIAAWVGTADTWQTDQAKKDADQAAGIKSAGNTLDVDDDEDDQPNAVPDPPTKSTSPIDEATADRLRRERLAARQPLDSLRAANFTPETATAPEPPDMVSGTNARRGMDVAGKAGFGLGAATGVGLGAVFVALWSKLRGRS